jgi:hypothetical protein
MSESSNGQLTEVAIAALRNAGAAGARWVLFVEYPEGNVQMGVDTFSNNSLALARMLEREARELRNAHARSAR